MNDEDEEDDESGEVITWIIVVLMTSLLFWLTIGDLKGLYLFCLVQEEDDDE